MAEAVRVNWQAIKERDRENPAAIKWDREKRFRKNIRQNKKSQ
jgi:hypothetical protein